MPDYWRTAAGAEVDFVVHSRMGLVPIEVKMNSRAQMADVRSLEGFLDEYSKDARLGVLLYGGDEVTMLTRRIIAVPARAIL